MQFQEQKKITTKIENDVICSKSSSNKQKWAKVNQTEKK